MLCDLCRLCFSVLKKNFASPQPHIYPPKLQRRRIHPPKLQRRKIHPPKLQQRRIHQPKLQRRKIHPPKLQQRRIHPPKLQRRRIHPPKLQLKRGPTKGFYKMQASVYNNDCPLSLPSLFLAPGNEWFLRCGYFL